MKQIRKGRLRFFFILLQIKRNRYLEFTGHQSITGKFEKISSFL